MLFKDINIQANKITEDDNFPVILEKKKDRFKNFKSTGVDVAKKTGNVIKDLATNTFDDAFDNIIKDGKKSSEEREKIKRAKEAGQSGWNIWKAGAVDGITGEHNPSDTMDDQDSQKNMDSQKDSNDGAKTKKETNNITLTPKDHVRLEKNIFNQNDTTKRKIFKYLVTLYNELANKNKLKTEAFNYLTLDKKLLSDLELIKILDYIHNAYKRNSKKIKESLIFEDTNKKLKNNIVSNEWKKRGSKRDKDNLVKLMRFFKLSDTQIFTAFEKVDKTLTYSELTRLKIDIKHSNAPVTKQDLQKLAHTLGKFKLNQFLIKLKNDIQK